MGNMVGNTGKFLPNIFHLKKELYGTFRDVARMKERDWLIAFEVSMLIVIINDFIHDAGRFAFVFFEKDHIWGA